MLSVRPSDRYSESGSLPAWANGRTAIESMAPDDGATAGALSNALSWDARSCADRIRSVGFFSIHRRIRRLSSGGAPEWEEIGSGGASRRMDDIVSATEFPAKARRPEIVS